MHLLINTHTHAHRQVKTETFFYKKKKQNKAIKAIFWKMTQTHKDMSKCVPSHYYFLCIFECILFKSRFHNFQGLKWMKKQTSITKEGIQRIFLLKKMPSMHMWNLIVNICICLKTAAPYYNRLKLYLAQINKYCMFVF